MDPKPVLAVVGFVAAVAVAWGAFEVLLNFLGLPSLLGLLLDAVSIATRR